MANTPPQAPSEGTPSGTYVVIGLAIFCLLFIAASFINPSDFMGGGESSEQAP
ncbi:MAG: hypothetical protein H6741_16285 [Alphaproteobacteria bacterium]|nr:hypothetical protein [Alphaproteobacteria bacterium]MCB9794273.1 hypothetical protein [Alphaproteobacteria bacterium]